MFNGPCAPHLALPCACVVVGHMRPHVFTSCTLLCARGSNAFSCAHSLLPPGFAFCKSKRTNPKLNTPPNHPNFHANFFLFFIIFISIPVGDSKGSSRGSFDSEYADSDMLEILRDISLFICARGMDRHGSEHGSFTFSFLFANHFTFHHLDELP